MTKGGKEGRGDGGVNITAVPDGTPGDPHQNLPLPSHGPVGGPREPMGAGFLFARYKPPVPFEWCDGSTAFTFRIHFYYEKGCLGDRPSTPPVYVDMVEELVQLVVA